jgi:hypothetical protein
MQVQLVEASVLLLVQVVRDGLVQPRTSRGLLDTASARLRPLEHRGLLTGSALVAHIGSNTTIQV